MPCESDRTPGLDDPAAVRGAALLGDLRRARLAAIEPDALDDLALAGVVRLPLGRPPTDLT